MKLIIGLGNPGLEYEETRHNTGFLAIQEIKTQNLNDEKWKFEKKFNAEIISGKIGREKVVLAKPQTFMNNSGQAIQKMKNFYKVKSEDIVVIHDDLDLPSGAVRIKENGSSGGHRGVESIIQALKTKEFIRFRIGIAPKSRRVEADKFVLQKFSATEMKKIQPIIALMPKIIETLFEQGVQKAMSKYNQTY